MTFPGAAEAQPLCCEEKWLFSLCGAALQWRLSQPCLCNGSGPRGKNDELGGLQQGERGWNMPCGRTWAASRANFRAFFLCECGAEVNWKII